MSNFPLYIVSKGRFDSRYTAKSLEAMNQPYFIVIEEQEYSDYSKVINKKNILVLDEKYKDNYDVFDKLGRTKSVGPGAARNFAMDHSIDAGFNYHWVMDDNIKGFWLYNDNQRIPCESNKFWDAMEHFVLRYKNVGMAGPNYYMFCIRKDKLPPFVINTRIYSCNLINNNLGYRWRGRYNEDTDLSLRMLKDGLCTIQFNHFLQRKINTQKVKGGNTAEFYSEEGTHPKSLMLKQMHPDVTDLSFKFGRHHHQVDYSPFKTNRLIKSDDYNNHDLCSNLFNIVKTK